MAQLTPRAQKDFLALPQPLQVKARDLIKRLDAEPALGKKLLGKLEGLRSAQLGRTHRIVYRVDPVVVLSIPNRRDAYR